MGIKSFTLRRPVSLLGLALPLLVVFAQGCGSQNGDPVADAGADPLGPGMRVRDVGNPNLKSHPASGASVNVTGASVLWVDTFDETANGKSRGTVYVQDVGSQDPYSAISIYSPSYIPASLRISPGDVMDFIGQYTEQASIGTAVFTAPDVLPQLSKPIGTFRYEYKTPDPLVIDPLDLNDFATGRKWMSMLVTLKNVSITAFANDGKGRVTAPIVNSAGQITAGTISNENYNLLVTDYAPGTTFTSVTGIVTWFFSYHIAPRTAADLVVGQMGVVDGGVGDAGSRDGGDAGSSDGGDGGTADASDASDQ
jgi:hypothetical protein